MIKEDEIVIVSFKFRDRIEEREMRADEAWELAQGLKRMYPKVLEPLQVRHEPEKHPLMWEGFMKVYQALVSVGINPR